LQQQTTTASAAAAALKREDNSKKKVIEVGQPVESFSNVVGVDRKVKQACSIGGQVPASLQRLVLELSRDEDKELIADFIIDSYHEKNIAVKTKCTYISNLVYLSRYLGHKKSFKDMTSQDVIEGNLHSLKRPIEADPDQKWINTHNQRAMVISKFFRWLAYPDLRSEERTKQKPIPPPIKGIKTVKKKGPRSNVKATDLWTWEEDALFLKYVEDPRIACYHAMARDASARPSEMLAIRIEDIKIKKAVDGKMFAEVEIGRYGKTKANRAVPLIKSLPYLKAWIAQHPQGSNPKAYLFVSLENSAKYRNTPLKASSLHGIYDNLRRHYFAKVILERPDVPPEEKAILKRLREAKPWNPYNRRHTGLTEKARLVNEYDLRQHAGWTKNSDMIEIYTHDLGNESSEDLLLAYGIDVRSTTTTAGNASARSVLEPKTCPNCSEPNKPDARFCISCKMVLTYDSHIEIINEAEQTKKKLEEIEARQTIEHANWSNLMKFFMGMEKEIKIHAWDVNEGPFQTAAKIIEDKKKEAQARD